jgi:predicted ATPase
MPHSEIRASQISGLIEKVHRGQYGKYLRSVRLVRVRGLAGAEVRFDFPVTALIGPNGGGKSTVLGAAACAYKELKPSTFFPKSSIGDTSMANWSIEYEAIDKHVNATAPIRRSSNFRQAKWVRGDVLSRPVAYFGINRTVPAGEKPSFKKLMGGSYVHTASLDPLPAAALGETEKVLGKSVQGFRQTRIVSGQTFYTGRNSGNEYSEFHFGAGESSIIRIISEIEALKENALVLIEEIENGLHPVATRRLVEYLIVAAERKTIQAIFTTHSDDALLPLPKEAIWACLDRGVQQGKLSVKTLRAVSGKIDTKLAVFVEDTFARHWIEAIIRSDLPEAHDEIEVHAVSGDGVALRIHRGHRDNPSIRFKSCCMLDGDSQQSHDEANGIYRLPGGQPELTVFDEVAGAMDTNIAVLTVACQLDPREQERVRRVVTDVRRTNRDPHLLFNQVGIQLGFVPEVIIRGAFVSQWIRDHKAAITPIVAAIRSHLAT